MSREKAKKEASYIPKDTLIIIGNGFDIWRGIPTSYNQFRKYYLSHRDEIMKRLGIKKRVFQDEMGQKISISDVELIYGNPFEPRQLSDQFWNKFENSLNQLDAEKLNLFFGKDRKGLREMRKSIRDASRIMREAFCNWIGEITINNEDASYRFGNNCLFINFNYTDTLQKHFNVREENEYHVHGEATDKDSIIFGHSTHPQLPEETLYQFRGRFRGLYFVEEILYETDKHVQDNIQSLCMFLAMHGVMPEEIKNIYVLGHSMGIPDIEYFAFLADATIAPNTKEPSDEESDENLCPIDEIHNRLQYVVNYVGYQSGHENLDTKHIKAVARKYSKEQAERNQEFQKMFLKLIGRSSKRGQDGSPKHTIPRIDDATWHISYYSDEDKQWIEALLDELGCKKTKLYPTIDECLMPFKIS
ncbi:hypothetical protein TSYNTROOL_15740 [Tepidanaerobacter syntrophicus]|uniref:bacteriophage abortive infection AbiH family protein n=1 Tax=Tepidanaerobacter syntrophicus TaxID=224999 RepID=UPI0022EE46F3|nr:bacteriophage abortive infection AbiH family protein [Tepidanaerobacter syntrophicus]GLI51488.1 hypothetical protein TSYNTROOL_15740 [Tepidanaerobacter syntrophicus]